jgi:hypothetical protein
MKRTVDNGTGGKSNRQVSGLGRRDVIGVGAGIILTRILKVPTTFGQEGQSNSKTIYAPEGYAESPPPVEPQSAQDIVYVCPMDPDIRSTAPGVCPRCGMRLVAGIPDYASEYRMDLMLTPRAPKPGEEVKLEFTVLDPWKNNRVTHFQIVHEKLFHLFVVSQDLQFFVHDHPTFNPDGSFTFNIAFPTAGMYRVLGDFYPEGGTPQLIAKTIFVPGAGASQPVSLVRDYSVKNTENMQVGMASDPPQPIAGMKTILKFHVDPTDGFEQYLGAWGHMLAASDDLIDLIHTHPIVADGGPDLQFNLILPRARAYRIWVQFQRKGIVNTARFDVPVGTLG